MAINPKIVVIGCGVVGALIAYELSRQFSSADITVLDKQQPAQGSTGAALGVLMGVISSRVKGRTWRLREASMRRYPSLIAELAEQGYSVPFNSQGIISLCFDPGKLPRWETLREKRCAQGWPLEIWSPEQLQARCPHVDIVNRHDAQPVSAAIYSPADGQVHPVALTRALVAAAESRGVTFDWSAEVTGLDRAGDRCEGVQTTQRYIEADWVMLTAGLGSAAIAHTAPQPATEPFALIPVLGQAMEIQLPAVLGNPDFQPVINGDDIHLVPLGEGRYWLGATVEFSPDGEMPVAAEAELEKVKRGGERFVGAIAHAKILSTWSGLRPRPVGQPAPVIKPLGNIENVLLATGHYRNGVLLAPATAQQVCERLAALRIV